MQITLISVVALATAATATPQFGYYGPRRGGYWGGRPFAPRPYYGYGNGFGYGGYGGYGLGGALGGLAAGVGAGIGNAVVGAPINALGNIISNGIESIGDAFDNDDDKKH